ncbi:hypothetical protein K1719_033702 [Acacia pycnantha]|nr:hypothetical protein K1719_033702 [Acacia pycnantha]
MIAGFSARCKRGKPETIAILLCESVFKPKCPLTVGLLALVQPSPDFSPSEDVHAHISSILVIIPVVLLLKKIMSGPADFHLLVLCANAGA